MRLFWKLFCSMVIVAAVALSLSGYALIYSQFKTALNREVSSLLEENDLTRYALTLEAGSGADQQQLTEAAARLAESTANQGLPFALYGSDGTLLTASPSFREGADPVATQLGKDERGWMLSQPAGNAHLLTAAAPLSAQDDTVYLESQRNVDDLYAQRNEQFRLFAFIESGAVALVGLAAALLALWILRPLRRLSGATRAVAQGNLQRRVPVTGSDELSMLSQDFNHMAEQMETHVRELTEAAQRQEDFIGAFAHEIKTPLTSVIGYAELLAARPASAQLSRESAQYILREGRRMEALSRKLMDLVVLDGQNLERRPVAADAFLAQVGGALEPALAAAGIALSVQAQPATVPLDADLAEAAVLNLIDNARKACADTTDARIALRGRVSNGRYLITVSDNGPGIPPEEVHRITEAFYMVDKSRSRAQGGAGLGLAICQRIVQHHGGTLEFASIVGRGTTARIGLPLQAPDRTGEGDTSPEAVPPGAPAPGPTPKAMCGRKGGRHERR